MDFEVKGAGEVFRELKRLDDKVKRREILKILRKQVLPIKRAIKANAPTLSKDKSNQTGKVQGGNLKKSIAIKTVRGFNPSVKIGPQTGRSKRKPRYDGFYAFFVQYGTINQAPNDFIAKAANPLMEGVHTTASRETERYLQKKINELNL